LAEVQFLNEYGRFKTNAGAFWNGGNQFGNFSVDSTHITDLNGKATNLFFTNTVSGDLNSFTILSENGQSPSGVFKIVPGNPDSVWVSEQVEMFISQFDSININAHIFDQFENLVSDGETVSWNILPIVGNGDGFNLSTESSSTINGMVDVTVLTDPTGNSLSVGDQIEVQAVSGNGFHQSAFITVIPDDIYNLAMPSSLTESQIDLSADVATIEIEATLIDTFNNPLEGVEVFWEVVTGAGTGENLSVNSSLTDGTGLATVTLNTSTVAGRNYTVSGWVSDAALLSVLMGNQTADHRNGSSPPVIKQEPGVNLGLTSGNKDIKSVKIQTMN